MPEWVAQENGLFFPQESGLYFPLESGIVPSGPPIVKSAIGTTAWSGDAFASFSTAGLSLAVGDLIIMGTYAYSGFFNASDSDNRAYPSGGSVWTTVQELVWGNTPLAGLYYKIANAADVAALAFTYYTAVANANKGGGITVIQAGTFNVSNPIQAWSFAKHVSGATTAFASATVLYANSKVLLITAVNASSSTPFVGFTEHYDSGSSAWGSSSVASATYPAGPTGVITHTASGSYSADDGGGVLVVVNPV